VQAAGGVEDLEMYRTFNMGVGLILVVRPETADPVVARLAESGEDAWVMGVVEGREDGGEAVVLA
jgi:phosphoribosylformylglycinamidine cyclo-ligase